MGVEGRDGEELGGSWWSLKGGNRYALSRISKLDDPLLPLMERLSCEEVPASEISRSRRMETLCETAAISRCWFRQVVHLREICNQRFLAPWAMERERVEPSELSRFAFGSTTRFPFSSNESVRSTALSAFPHLLYRLFWGPYIRKRVEQET